MPQRVESSVEIEAPVEKVYDYWKTLENLPQFMTNVEEIRPTGPDTTHWVVKGPLGAKLEFDAKTTQNKPNEAIGWNTENGQVQTSGQVRFQKVDEARTRVETSSSRSKQLPDALSSAFGNHSLRAPRDRTVLLPSLNGRGCRQTRAAESDDSADSCS